MEDEILFWAGIRRHKGSLFGVAALLFLAACSLCTVLTVYLKGNGYIRQEMRRAGFGSLTAWVSDVPDVEGLAETIRQQEGVAKTRAQRLIYTEYEENGVESDSEGQLIPWSAKDERYKFIRDDLSGYKEAPEEILPGEVFASPSMASVMGLKIGDTITFLVARGGRDVSLTVAGYYEDPFMGSAMIGMKGFLISQRDYQRVREIIRAEGMNALARDGAMLHIAMASQAGYTISDLSRALNEDTPLSMYTEFIHSADAISGFMTILQNAFCGLLAAFAIVLLVVAFLALGHSISGMVEQDFRDFGILKTVGMTGKRLVRLQAMQYGASAAVGLLSGILVAIPASRAVSRITVTSSGFLIPTGILVLPCLGVFAGLLALLLGFTVLRLWRVHDIAPLDAIRGQARVGGGDFYHFHSIRARGLSFQLALRQLLWGKRRYVSSCMVAALLVFFASLVGRMDGWLGPDGKGMMDAFNPADLDLGVQVLGDLEAEEMERVVASYSDITDSYLLAMPDVFLSVPNAVASAGMGASNYTANVISEPDRFHVSRGRTSENSDEVVLTEVVAGDLGVDVGDIVVIRGDLGEKEFTVSGIYHCANDMGANLGMSREGYLSIGQDDHRLWCYHYFLADPSQKQAITETLEQTYGGDVHVHENTWPGLSGILAAMQMLLAFLYVVSAVFICIVTALAGSKILDAEQKDLGIYKSIGCAVRMLRLSFALRFGMVAAVGAVMGSAAAWLLADPLTSAVMRRMGISNYASYPPVGNLLSPGILVTVLFFAFAYLAAGRIKKEDMSVLTVE